MKSGKHSCKSDKSHQQRIYGPKEVEPQMSCKNIGNGTFLTKSLSFYTFNAPLDPSRKSFYPTCAVQCPDDIMQYSRW
jgi:hypothetical protein